MIRQCLPEKNRTPTPPSARYAVAQHAAASSPIAIARKACAGGGYGPRCQTDTPVQPNLRVDLVDDPYEREAERIVETLAGNAPVAIPVSAGRSSKIRARTQCRGRASSDFGESQTYVERR